MVRHASNSYSFSYSVDSYSIRVDEDPLSFSDLLEPTVPVGIFASDSTLRALVRHLRDNRNLSTTQIATMLGRTPQCIAATYRASSPLPAVDDNALRIPVRIFRSPLSPLEALVTHLRASGLRNSEVATLLALDPRTTWTATKRAEAKQ